MSDRPAADNELSPADFSAAALTTAAETVQAHVLLWLEWGGDEAVASAAIDAIGGVHRYNRSAISRGSAVVSRAYARERERFDEFLREAERNSPGPSREARELRAAALTRLEFLERCCSALDLIAYRDFLIRDYAGEAESCDEIRESRESIREALAVMPAAPLSGRGNLPKGISEVYAEDESDAPCGSLVRGLIDDGALVAIYGAPNSGKSFLAACFAGGVSEGAPIDGRPTRQALVVYWAAEGGERFADRIRAWQKQHDTEGQNLLLLTGDFDLTTPDGADALLDRLRGARMAHALPVGVLVIDTVARALSGADENSASAMGAFLKSVARIQAAGVTVILVHHSGKKVSEGLRGHSSLAAACDTIIEVASGPDGNVARVVKQRDMPCEGELRFRIVSEGRSAVVEFDPPAAVAKPAAAAPPDLVGLLAADVAAAAAAGRPLRANGTGSAHKRRAELSTPLRSLGRDPFAALIRQAIGAKMVQNTGGELFRVN